MCYPITPRTHWPFIRTWYFSQPLHEPSVLTYTFCAGCVLLSAAGSGFILKRPAHFAHVVRRESARPFGKTIPFSFLSPFLFLIRHSLLLFSSPLSHFLSLFEFLTQIWSNSKHAWISEQHNNVSHLPEQQWTSGWLYFFSDSFTILCCSIPFLC